MKTIGKWIYKRFYLFGLLRKSWEMDFERIFYKAQVMAYMREVGANAREQAEKQKTLKELQDKKDEGDHSGEITNQMKVLREEVKLYDSLKAEIHRDIEEGKKQVILHQSYRDAYMRKIELIKKYGSKVDLRGTLQRHQTEGIVGESAYGQVLSDPKEKTKSA